MSSSPSVSTKYSTFNPVVLRSKGRIRIAKQILKVTTEVNPDKKLNKMRVLDLGCSSGIIANYLSKYFGEVIGIDNDVDSLTLAKKSFKKRNLRFEIGDALDTKFSKGSFDIVLANQIYYCFDKPRKLMDEMKRVLKEGGTVFFGARNKYTLWDAQYHLPMLAFMPRPLADFFVKSFGRSEKFNANYMDWWQLESLCREFEIEKLTPRIIKNPKLYGFKSLEKLEFLTNFIPLKLLEFIEPALPNFIWILKKR